MKRSPEREEFLADVVVTVAEDYGTNSWRQVSDYKWQGGNKDTFVKIIDVETDDGENEYYFGINEAAKGIRRLLTGSIQVNDTIRGNVAAANNENDAGCIDAYDADMILQAAIFGELIYG